MRVAAVTLAYNDEGVIAGTLKCLKGFVDKHIVLISEKPYFGESAPPDNTFQICMDNEVEVIKGTWKLDHFQRNLGNRMCQGYDWILGFDSDEMMTKDELLKLFEFLEKTDAQAVAIRPEVYWKTTNYRLRPIPDYAPVVAFKPNVRFTHIRNIDTTYKLYNGEMHHLSWCAPKDIYKKVLNYAHATDFDGQKWYDEHYKNWHFTVDKNVVLPDGIYKAEFNPLPKELERYL